MRFTVSSGGQTGSDQGGLFAARSCGVTTGGWAPLGWKTEDGPAVWLEDFSLLQCQVAGFPARTAANVNACHACVWFGDIQSKGGKLTARLCLEANRPLIAVRVGGGLTPKIVAGWFEELSRRYGRDEFIILVAGNRESVCPGIGARVEKFMAGVLKILKEADCA